MTELAEFIKDKRPTLSASSVKTYVSILKNLYKKVFKDDDVQPEKFKETDTIMKHLEDMPPNKRKTILSALVIATNNDKYRDLMLDDVKRYNQEISKQEKTDSQQENWVTQEEVKQMYDSLKKNANAIYKKEHKTKNDLQMIQNFIILALFTLIPPRRSKDFVDFRIKDINKNEHNYFDKNKLVFNSYKTAKTYGKQEVPAPKELVTVLNKWIKTNPTKYLLFDTNMNPLTAVKLNQRFNRIFDGRKVAINALRHSYLTDKYADQMKVQKKMENDMQLMGSSTKQAETYVKLD